MAAEGSESPNVVVTKLVVAPEGHDPFSLDLTKGLDLKKNPIVIKEGSLYRIKLYFKVNREIVSGLRYFHAAYRKGIRVDKQNNMVGTNYGPKTEEHVYTCPEEEAPKGLLSRGNYVMKSKFTDDDNKPIVEWEWAMDIKKDWE